MKLLITYKKMLLINHESEKRAKHRLYVSCGVVITLLALIVLIVLLFKRHNHRITQEKESLFEAYKELTSRTEEEKAAIRKRYIQMCHSHFGHLGHINELLYYHAKDSDNYLYQELKKSIQKAGMDEQNQLKFEELLNASFDNVMAHFREDFPGKKPIYYQFVSLLFAGFSAATICTIITSYNKHNVYVEKSRLKQMIQASPSSHKEQFLLILP